MNTILHILLATGLFATGELLANWKLFPELSRQLNLNNGETSHENSERLFNIKVGLIKGILERLMLYIALHYGFTNILVVFGTLKLGTRISDRKEVSNNYFFIGNIISILMAIAYTITYAFLGKLF